MATSFPTGLDALTNPTGASSLTSPDHAGQHADANDAIESLQAKVGVNGSAVTSSLDYKIANIPATSITTGTLDNARLPAAATTITSVGTLTGLRVDGNFGIGASGLTQTGLRLAKDIGGSAFSQGIYAHGTIQPSVTSRSDTVWSNPTVAASVTLPALNHFYASSPAIGAGSTITTVIGYSAESNLGNNYSGTVTNVYAFSGNIASGTGRWNFFANGTANNYMAGRLGVGQAVTSGAMAQVVNTTAADKAFVIRGAASQSGDFIDIQNSAGTSQFKVDSLGYVGIGTATPFQPAGYGALTIDGSSGSIISGRVAGTETFRIQSTAASTTINNITALPIIFNTSNTERMRIDPTGNLLVGATSRRSVGGAFQTSSVHSIFNEQVGPSGALTPFTSVLNRADSNGLRFVLGKSRGTAVGGVTALVANDSIAEFHFAGADGTTLDPLAARIMVHVDGAVATGSVPGRLSFATNPVAGTNPVERMRITNAGLVGIGTTAPVAKLEVLGSDTVSSQTNVSGAFGTTTSGRLLLGSITGNTPFIGSEGATNLVFTTNAIERMRITNAGNIGIGNSGGGDTSVSIGSNITGATTAYGIRSLQTIQSGVTASAFIFSSQPSTVASAFTVADLVHFRANSTTIGSTSAVTNQYGFSASANLTGATGFNIGFHGNIGAGTNRYNIYMDGTAQNYLAGRLGVGAILTSGATTQITNPNASPADKVLVVKGAASQSGSLLEAQNSSGTALVTIDSAGKVGIGNTAPENTLDITGSFGRGNPAVKTANFTLAGTENWIICNGAGTISITLPTPSTCDGREFGIKTVSPQLVQSASSNVIGIGGGAAGTAILPATSGAWAILVSDGASWNIMCRGT